MNKLYAKTILIEVTRRCNMTCAHCMRGNAEDQDLSHKDIRRFLSYFKHIHSLTITGGEPSLNPSGIRSILQELKRNNIHVYDFYIVTNGSQTSVSKEFIDACSELYLYQENKDMGENNHMLAMSNDKYHEKQIQAHTVKVLSQYPFFGLRNQSERIFLFNEGRCKDGFPNTIHPIYLTDQDYVYGEIYLNARGEILSNCNLSYSRQAENILCHVSDFCKYIQSTLRTD